MNTGFQNFKNNEIVKQYDYGEPVSSTSRNGKQKYNTLIKENTITVLQMKLPQTKFNTIYNQPKQYRLYYNKKY